MKLMIKENDNNQRVYVVFRDTLYGRDKEYAIKDKMNIVFTEPLPSNFVIPSDLGIKTIGKYCFENSNIKSITIPLGVEEIDERAFRNSSLESITIPNSVNTLRSFAFEECKRLKSLNLPESVHHIYLWCFHNSGITNITSSAGFLNYNAFEGCYTLKTITLLNDVKNISCGIFCGSINVESVKMTPYTEKLFKKDLINKIKYLRSFDNILEKLDGPQGFGGVIKHNKCKINGIPLIDIINECIEAVEKTPSELLKFRYGEYDGTEKTLTVQLPAKLARYLDDGDIDTWEIENFLFDSFYGRGLEYDVSLIDVVFSDIEKQQAKSLYNETRKWLVALQNDI